MTDFLFDSQSGGSTVSGFVVTPLDLMTTELNGAGSGTTQVSSVGGESGVFESAANFGQCIWAYLWFKSGGALSLTAGTVLSGWFLTSPDGNNFEVSPPARSPDFIIPLPAAVVSGDLYPADGLIRLPSPDAKIALQNGASGSLAAAGNVLICGPVAVKY